MWKEFPQEIPGALSGQYVESRSKMTQSQKSHLRRTHFAREMRKVRENGALAPLRFALFEHFSRISALFGNFRKNSYRRISLISRKFPRKITIVIFRKLPYFPVPPRNVRNISIFARKSAENRENRRVNRKSGGSSTMSL